MRAVLACVQGRRPGSTNRSPTNLRSLRRAESMEEVAEGQAADAQVLCRLCEQVRGRRLSPLSLSLLSHTRIQTQVLFLPLLPLLSAPLSRSLRLILLLA
eukprot:4545392-Pleurochrysis_carterae.AAC.1